MTNLKKIFILAISIILMNTAFAENPGFGIGSDAAYPTIAELCKALPVKSGHIYIMTDEEVEKFIDTASTIEINVFELLDCIYRYTSENNIRVKIEGSSLQKLLPYYDLGKERVMAMLPLDRMVYLTLGAKIEDSDNALDVFLEKEYSEFIEIGTVMYKKHFGFKTMEPNLFADPFGMKVKARIFNIKKDVNKIHLYKKGLGAFYVHGFFKPKRWNLWLITKKQISE